MRVLGRFLKILPRMSWACWGLMGLSDYFRDFFGFSQRCLLYYWKLSEKSSWSFGFLQNLTVYEWQGVVFCCINKVNIGRARAVVESIVSAVHRWESAGEPPCLETEGGSRSCGPVAWTVAQGKTATAEAQPGQGGSCVMCDMISVICDAWCVMFDVMTKPLETLSWDKGGELLHCQGLLCCCRII